MKALIAFCLRYYYLALFILLEGTALVLLFNFGAWQSSVWFSAASEVAGRVYAVQSTITAFLHQSNDNARLTAKNLVLEQRVAALSTLLERATHDSTYTERHLAEVLQPRELIAAQVVHNEIRRRDNYITIDRGRADGVEAEMGVVSGTSVVGIVYMASEHYSIVLPILNSGCSISCRLRQGKCFGYLRWKGGSSRRAVLDDVPRHARIKVGDVVETSGYSAVFPEGLFVGRVTRVGNSEDGLSYLLDVGLGTDFSRLRHVAVIKPLPHSEEIQALKDSVISQR